MLYLVIPALLSSAEAGTLSAAEIAGGVELEEGWQVAGEPVEVTTPQGTGTVVYETTVDLDPALLSADLGLLLRPAA